MVFLFHFGVFLNLFTSKVPYFLCKSCLFLCFIFLFFFNYIKISKVTLLSPGTLFWLILECSKLQFFPFISMGAHFSPKHKIKEFFSPI